MDDTPIDYKQIQSLWKKYVKIPFYTLGYIIATYFIVTKQYFYGVLLLILVTPDIDDLIRYYTKIKIILNFSKIMKDAQKMQKEFIDETTKNIK